MTDIKGRFNPALSQAGMELPVDGPDTDRTDLAITARTQQHLDRDDLEWMLGKGPDEDRATLDDDLPSWTDIDETPLWTCVANDVGQVLQLHQCTL